MPGAHNSDVILSTHFHALGILQKGFACDPKQLLIESLSQNPQTINPECLIDEVAQNFLV